MPGASSLSASGGEYRVAMLCASVLVLEGVDLGAMAFTLPALSESWHLRPVAFKEDTATGDEKRVAREDCTRRRRRRG